MILLAISIAIAVYLIFLYIGFYIETKIERKKFYEARAKRLCWDIGIDQKDFKWFCEWSFNLTDPEILRK